MKLPRILKKLKTRKGFRILSVKTYPYALSPEEVRANYEELKKLFNI